MIYLINQQNKTFFRMIYVSNFFNFVNRKLIILKQKISSRIFQNMSQKFLSVNQVTLTWRDITVNADKKTILSSVSGYCRPGQMLAIMGPSGAGKTTLLSLLASKKSQTLSISGMVHANKSSFSAQQFYNFGVYIYQNDILHEMLTVKQTIEFIARLKIINQQQSEKRVNEMISIFQLQKCKDTFVGGRFKKGISGGEKKRVCIAVEMIADPSVLVLDQPTSGLDSNKARTIIKTLKRLAKQENKTIVFTLHQPSYLIYQDLDRLMLLNQGRTIYQGKSSQFYNYISSELGITVPLDCTLSDFFMMEISEYKDTKYDHKTLLNSENYNLKLKKTNQQELEQATQQIQIQGYERLKAVRTFWFMFAMLLQRQWTIFKRNPMKGVRIVMNSILMVVIAGLIFLNGISSNRPQKDRIYQKYEFIQGYFLGAQGVTFIAIVSCIMTGIFSVSLAFPNDRQIYYKETTSKKYYPIAYLISKIMIEAGSVIVGTIIFAVGEYFIVGYTADFNKLVRYVISLVACALVGNSLGILTGSLFKDAKRASALTPAFLLPLMMFSGLYNKLNYIPNWISWLQYISPFRYGLHSVLLNQFQDQIFMTKSEGNYSYKQDLAINIDYMGNILLLFSLALLYYGISFVLLKKLSSNLAP